MYEIHPVRAGAAAAITFSVLFTICAAAVVLFPEATINFFNTWFHGLDLTLLRPDPPRVLTIRQFVYGLVGVIAVSYLAGSAYALVYNLLKPR